MSLWNVAKEQQACELCGRVTKRGTTEHHLIPRTVHRNKWFKKNYSRAQMLQTVSLCRDCHGAIHRFVPDEKRLGRELNSLDKLMADDLIGGFVRWVSKRR